MSVKPVEYLEIANAAEAKAMGLPWDGQPMGALLCQGRNGARLTKLTTDIEYHRLLVSETRAGRSDGMVVKADKYPLARDGWPGDPGW